MDVLASDRGKQCYELNKNVRWANVYDPDGDPEPAIYTDMIGVLKVGGLHTCLCSFDDYISFGHLSRLEFLFQFQVEYRLQYLLFRMPRSSSCCILDIIKPSSFI